MSKFVRKLFWHSGTNRNEKNGKPLEYWEELEMKKRVTTTSGEEQLEIWEPTDLNFWKDNLNRKEYNVLRNKGTEAPRSSMYHKFYPTDGYFACRACGNPLYLARAKFDSGTGWPSFGTGIEHNVVTKPHYTWGLRRDEVCCRRCRSHLGHVFAERNTSMHDRLETFTERQCINGVCLKYIKEPIPAGINPKARLLSS